MWFMNDLGQFDMCIPAQECGAIAAALGRTISATATPCGTLAGCYLYDLNTGHETTLSASTTIAYSYIPGSSRHSILCDVDGTINEMDFGFLPEGLTHKTWGAPYWIDGSSGDYVEQADWLQSCGDKTLSVHGKTWTDTCFTATFQLRANCDSTTTATVAPIDEGDLSVRFSKITKFDAQTVYIEPLKPTDYPVGGAVAKRLAQETTASSVMVPGDHDLRGIDEWGYVQRVGGPPTHPNSDPNHPFWDDFRVVVEAQQRRRNGDMSDLNLPKIWRDLNFNVTDVAMAIRAEFPGHWQAILIENLFKEGVKLDTTVMPFRSKVDFVGGPVRMAALNTWAIIRVSPTNFRLKWMFGRARPEEVAFQIQNGDIPASAVPADVLQTLRQWNLTKQEEFTAYKEGAPRHPSWPAMHSAASSCSLWMNVVFDLTPEQKCQGLLTDYIVSYGRTVAGVHYPTDNMVGLNLGQEILADYLVDHLVEEYGANRTAAQAKVDANRFDWNDFDPKTCKIKGRR